MNEEKEHHVRKKPIPCRFCLYRSEANFPHNCDYLWFTGQSRTSQVSSPDQLEPKNCPFYKRGRRPSSESALRGQAAAVIARKENQKKNGQCCDMADSDGRRPDGNGMAAVADGSGGAAKEERQ